MGGNYRRHVVAYADYFKDFKRSLDKASVARIYQTFLYVMTFDKIPAKFFRSITSVKCLYEIRVEYESNMYRIFCCIDGDLIVLLNGFHKKSLKNMGLSSLEEMIAEDFGPQGSVEREAFDRDTETFILAERLKEERLKAGLTQEQLAEKIGTKKSYISRLENGKADVQLSTLFRIFEGLGRRIRLTIL